MSVGRLFHKRGAATANAPSPSFLRVRGTYRSPLSAVHNKGRDGRWATGVIRSTMYRGACPTSVLWTSRHSLKSILSAICSQCSSSVASVAEVWTTLKSESKSFSVWVQIQRKMNSSLVHSTWLVIRNYSGCCWSGEPRNTSWHSDRHCMPSRWWRWGGMISVGVSALARVPSKGSTRPQSNLACMQKIRWGYLKISSMASRWVADWTTNYAMQMALLC